MTGKLMPSALVAAAVLAVAALIALSGDDDARAGIITVTLDPATATNLVGTDHTVTATTENWPTGEIIDFQVTSGPNAGATFTCSPNVDCSTDINAEVSATYTSNGTAGTDTIQACTTPLIPNALGEFQPVCGTATKEWGDPSPTPTVVQPTPSPTTVAVATEQPETLPTTGGSSGDDGGFPWVVAVLGALGSLSALSGGLLLRKRSR